MAESNSQLARSSKKQEEIERIADHIIETYEVFSRPIVLMWRETRNGFFLKLSPDYPTWTRDDGRVHLDFDRFGKGVKKILEKQATVIRVNGNIRSLVKHGHMPDRSGKRTDAAYRACIPSSSSPAFGFAIFPRATQEDHPLILETLRRGNEAAVTRTTNCVRRTRAANDLENLSLEARDEFLGGVQKGVAIALEDPSPLLTFIEQQAAPPCKQLEQH